MSKYHLHTVNMQTNPPALIFPIGTCGSYDREVHIKRSRERAQAKQTPKIRNQHSELIVIMRHAVTYPRHPTFAKGFRP